MFVSIAGSAHPLRASRRMSLLSLFSLWKSRRQLKLLTAEQLQDAGLSHGDAATEAARPIWDVPANWLR